MCPLCSSASKAFEIIQQRKYYQCTNCTSIFLSDANFISREAEKNRYLEHNNNVNDIGYQQFVAPLVALITKNHYKDVQGLDFGSGTGPVITKLLKDLGYDIKTWDPFFDNNPDRLKSTYNYIVSCEVIEHFHHPFKEFQLLKSLLKPKGSLYLKTELINAEIDFKTWYYKEDPTHVFFYSESSFEWIKTTFGFKDLAIQNRIVHLQQ